MDFEMLGECWREQPSPEEDRSAPEAIREARARAEALDRAVRRRDRVETGAALVLLPVFAWFALTTVWPLSAAGAWILVAACVLTPLRLRIARAGRTDPGRPVAEALRFELQRVRRQERLLESVAWWYVAPSVLGAVLLVGGGPGSFASKGLYAAAAVALGAWIVRLNRTAVRRELAPVARGLERWLAELDAELDAHTHSNDTTPDSPGASDEP